jgi:hypothetical protein
LWGTSDRVLHLTGLGQDAGLQERLYQPKDALVGDPSAHAVQQGRMVDLVERSRDTLPASWTFQRRSGSPGSGIRLRVGCWRC